MKAKTRALTMLATIAMLLTLFAPIASVRADTGWLVCYDTGDGGTAAYIFRVYNPGSFALDQDWLNITVKSDPMVLGVGAEENWYVHVYIDDGTTNYSWNKTLAVKQDGTVYSNISYSDPGSRWTATGIATIYVTVMNATFVIKDTTQGEIGIYETSIGESVGSLLPAFITLGLFALMMGWIKKSIGHKPS